MSTIYVHLMEEIIIKKQISSGNLISYHRYANDCILIIRKNAIRGFMNEINSYDKGLKFTLEEMSPENEIFFLDTKIFIENGILEFIKHKKGGAKLLSNFKHSNMSIKYFKGNI